MSWKEQAKENAEAEKKKLKDMNFKQKLQYFWDYYKGVLVILLCIGVAADIGYTVYRNTRLEHLLDIGMVNCISFGGEIDDMMSDFREEYDVDDKNRTISVDSSFQIDLEGEDQMSQGSMMKLMVVAQTDTLDVLLMPREIYESYAQDAYFKDIREVLSEGMQEKVRDQLAYSRCKEDTEDVPYAIVLTDLPKLQNIYPAGDVYMAFTNRIKNPEMAEEFLKYLLP